MASADGHEIEPLAVCSVAPTLDMRRFSKDQHNLSPEEVDGLMNNSGEENSVPMNRLCTV